MRRKLDAMCADLPSLGSKHLIFALYFHLSCLDTEINIFCFACSSFLPAFPFSLIKADKAEGGGGVGGVSTRCTELDVMDLIRFGRCSWLEKSGVKAVDHLELRVMSVSIWSSAERRRNRGIFK